MERREYSTKARERLIGFLRRNSGRRMSAQEISEAMAAEDSGVNLATVYRTLEKLGGQGRVLKSRSPGTNSFSYQLVEPDAACHSHLHLQCKACGRVFHLNNSVMQEFSARLQSEYGFSVDCDDSVMQGLCDGCK